MGKSFRRPAVILLALALTVSLGVILWRAYDGWQAARDNAEASQVAGLEEDTSQEPQPPVPPPPPEEPEPLPQEAADLADLDLPALQAVNGDVIGWLEIPGTELSYPLVQGEDNQFYLNHNWKRESSGAGAVFLEETNSRDLTGFHLIAYAHRMNNDSMFGTLKYYKEQDFWEEHPSIYLADGGGVRRYDIFAAQEASITGLVYRLDLEESGLEAEFIHSCLENSVIDTGVVPEAGEQVLTLSTCTGHGHATRWVVQGVLRGQYEVF